MKSFIGLNVRCAALLVPMRASAQGVYVDLSLKAIVNPATGRWGGKP